MKKFVNRLGIETLIFAKSFEDEAMEQLKVLSNSEAYNASKIRIMPDGHAGKSCPIGTTMTISNKVTPNLVGVDIGCGMLTIRLQDSIIDFAALDECIRKQIPSGFSVRDRAASTFNLNELRCLKEIDAGRAALSLGTLGGGNHFIEIGQSEKSGSLYLIIHSGSRKLGTDVCSFYQEIADQVTKSDSKELRATIKKLKKAGRTKEIESTLKTIKKDTSRNEISYLSGNDFDNYLNDMHIVQRYASKNRFTMAEIILHLMKMKPVDHFETVHNYIDFTRMILRKGAVRAEKGERILIPLNMRDGSLLCTGKGNEQWNYSAPHGAGRLMSRNKAKSTLTMDNYHQAMQGVFTTSVSPSTLDESPEAYKPTEEIETTITDTAIIDDRLKPLYNFKSP
jgi:tRNA-splicing ligase RtcB